MKTFTREELIRRSTKFRVLKSKDELFVNMKAITHSYNFVCKEKNLDIELERETFTRYPILTNLSVDGKEFETDGYFTEASIEKNLFTASFSDGKEIKCSCDRIDYDIMHISKQELKELILKNVEEF